MAKLRDVRRRSAVALVTALVLAGAVTMLSACNTVAGAGQDISATGHAVTGGAEKTKQAMPPNQ
jgi:entericidin B